MDHHGQDCVRAVGWNPPGSFGAPGCFGTPTCAGENTPPIVTPSSSATPTSWSSTSMSADVRSMVLERFGEAERTA